MLLTGWPTSTIAAETGKSGIVVVVFFPPVYEVMETAAAHVLNHYEQPVRVSGRTKELTDAWVPQGHQNPQFPANPYGRVFKTDVGQLRLVPNKICTFCFRPFPTHVCLQPLDYDLLNAPF